MTPRGRLFRKYVIVFAGLVSGALLASGAIEIYFSYQENRAGLVTLQREKALGVASRIEDFIKEIERQIGWTTQPQLGAPAAAMYQRRVDYLRLLRQVLAITEISHLDAEGKEQLRVSRLAMDVTGSGIDFSHEPEFVEAKAGKVYHGPVKFRKESEPYMTIAIAGSGKDAGVTVAAVNLKFIWDVVSQIKIGKAGHAYVIDSRGQLIAHPDISLVLKKSDFSASPQVQAARAPHGGIGGAPEPATIAQDLQGRQVLTAFAPIAPLGWLVFVEQPLVEAFEGIRASIIRAALLILVGVALSVVAGLVLARRMVKPIQALQSGAARIGAGELGHRIEVKTGDELETLADQFNRTAAQLEESYASLEHKVEARTRELSQAGATVILTAEGRGSLERATEVLGPDTPSTRVQADVSEGFWFAPDPNSPPLLALLTEEDLFGRRRHTRAAPRLSRRRSEGVAVELSPGDLAVHRVHGVGRYLGMVRRAVAGAERDYLLLEYAEGDKLYVPSDQVGVVAKYLGGEAPRLHRLGGTDWVRATTRVGR